ncbi:MAG TPA: cation:proton antiporter [Miltoncostaeaceae bacterium]|nr:cation:proton antiporter [Miltoncostaeaceae bacterium]
MLIVAAVAFAVPLLLGLAPRLRLSAGALELAVGIAIGPSGLGWVEIDEPIEVLAMLGLAFLLFLAGIEVDLARLRRPLLGAAGRGFLMSIGLALGVGYGLQAAGLVDGGALVAVILSATYLGAIAPVLRDAGRDGSAFGQLTLAGAAIANFAAVILLSLLFSQETSDAGARLVLLAGFVVLAVLLAVGLSRVERSMRLSAALLRLQDTSAQIRVRGAFVLLAGFVALASALGVEVILAAFTAGAILALVDRDAMHTHPQLRTKLEGAGFGFFIPVFMVASGIRFDLDALLGGASTIALAPTFLVALLLVRGLPALLTYRPLIGGRLALAAGLLQATSLPFIVAAAQIAASLGSIGQGTSAALIAAGLLSLSIFPETAKAILARRDRPAPAGRPRATPAAHGGLQG